MERPPTTDLRVAKTLANSFCWHFQSGSHRCLPGAMPIVVSSRFGWLSRNRTVSSSVRTSARINLPLLRFERLRPTN